MPNPITPELRRQILEAFAFNPKRRALLEKALPGLEEILKKPGTKRAFVGGSFTSPKVGTPSDIDIFIQRNPEYFTDFFKNIKAGMQPDAALADIGHGKTLDITRVGGTTPADALHEPWGEGAKAFLQKGKERYGQEYRWKRIFGPLLGLGAAGEMLSPDEAEAAPLIPFKPKISKRALKELAPEISSATEALKGQTIRGQTIKEVRKAEGNWRVIVFEDNTHMIVKKDHIQSASAAFGRKKALGQFEKWGQARPALRDAAQEVQALTSITKRRKEMGLSMSQPTLKQWMKNYEKLVGELDPELVPKDQVLFRYQGRTFQVPRRYGEVFEKFTKGEGKMLKEFKNE